MPSHSNAIMPSNVFVLSKEYSDAERSIRSQMLVTSVDSSGKAVEQIWVKDGYFGKMSPDFSIHKNDFPENALIYTNQAYLTFKDRKAMIYCDYAVLGQIIPFKTQPETNIDEFISKDVKFVKIYAPSYDRSTGEFLGIDEKVGYIMLRNVEDEVFFSYGYSEEHATVLFCHQKQSIPNEFRGTAFNSHRLNTYLENKAIMSDICFYLPSITDRKEDINRYKTMVSLTPVTCNISDINAFSPEEYNFNPKHLDEDGKNQKCARETLYSFFKNVAKVSNSNLVQNVHTLLKKKGIPHDSVKWAKSLSHAKADFSKFQLTR